MRDETWASQVKIRFKNNLLTRIVIFIIVTVAATFGADIFIGLIFKESLRRNVDEMTKSKTAAQRLLASQTNQATQKVCRIHPFFGHTMQTKLDAAPLGWHLETDQNGFRNSREFDVNNVPDDVIVIGLFGGSAAFGWEVDGNQDTLASHLEELFNSRSKSNTKFRIVNLGIPGWHYPQQFFLISRIIQHLDGIITYDGFNEIMVPLGNTLAYQTALPPDFPSGLFYLPIFQKQTTEQILALYGLLMFEANYDPKSLLAHSAIYNKLRYMHWDKERNRVAKIVQLGTSVGSETSSIEAKTFATDPQSYEEIVKFGIDEHAKYSQLVDLIAKQYNIPVLHVLQPFHYADPDNPFDPTMVPTYSRLAFANGHPSVHYSKLRERFAELAKQADPDNSIGYLDLSDALKENRNNWIDLIHPSAKGNRVAAEKIIDFIESSPIRFTSVQ